MAIGNLFPGNALSCRRPLADAQAGLCTTTFSATTARRLAGGDPSNILPGVVRVLTARWDREITVFLSSRA
jgi:hypothetical protein